MIHRRLKNLYNRFKPFIRYSVVGSLGTAIDFVVFYLLREYVGLHLLLATAAAFLFAVVNNFILNKIWTFENKHPNFTKQFIKFLIVATMGLLLSLISMHVLVEYLKLGDFGVRGELLAKAITSLIVLSWNFLGNKLWTFKDKIWDIFDGEQYPYALSVVVPAYNEEKRVALTIDSIEAYLAANCPKSEVIVVNDGSKDATSQVVNDLKERYTNLKLVALLQNSGKGAAVKEGVLIAEGKYILFMDADNSTHIEELEKMLPFLEQGEAEVAIGSRYLADSNIKRRQPWYRVFIGRFGNRLIRTLLLDDIYDTQCGFKLFHNRVAKNLFQRMKINRFGFDMEILSIAQNVLGYRIKEVAVDWYDAPGTRVRPIKAALKTFCELIWIKLNLLGKRYD